MNFEEVRELLKKEHENKLDKNVVLNIPLEEKRDYQKLQGAITSISKFNKDVEAYLEENSLVNSIQETQKGIYELKTKYGNTFLLTPSTYFKGAIPFLPIVGNCYNNSLTNTLVMSYQENPAVSVGIFFASEENHILHAISEFDYQKERYIIDYNYQLIMSKDLYCKLYNFTILNTIKKEKLHELFNLRAECKEHTQNREDSKNFHSVIYLELAPEEYQQYLQDVIEDKRLDDYKFVTYFNLFPRKTK